MCPKYPATKVMKIANPNPLFPIIKPEIVSLKKYTPRDDASRDIYKKTCSEKTKEINLLL